MLKRILPVLCLALLLLPFEAAAQPVMKGLEIGPWVGTSIYFGDLNTDFKLNRANLAGGFGARYNFNHRLSAKASLNYGRIEAYDSDSDNPFELNRNLSFQNNVFDGTLQFEFNFLPYIHGHDHYWFTPYAFGGFSVFNHNPKAVKDDGTVADLRSLGTEGQMRGDEYGIINLSLAYGIGFKWDLSYELSLDANLGVRSGGTDYLDDVSTTYADASDLLRSRGPDAFELYDRSLMRDSEGNRIDRVGDQRGDDTVKDVYLFAGIGINYYFGDVRCPKVGSGRARRR